MRRSTTFITLVRPVSSVSVALAALLGVGALGCVEVELPDDVAGDESDTDGGDDDLGVELPDLPNEPEDPELGVDPEPPMPEPEEPEPEPVCGNFIVEAGEECDNVGFLEGCLLGDGLALCRADCTLDTSTCGCPVGSEGCPCNVTGICDAGLECDPTVGPVPLCESPALECGNPGDLCAGEGDCCPGLACSPSITGAKFCG